MPHLRVGRRGCQAYHVTKLWLRIIRCVYASSRKRKFEIALLKKQLPSNLDFMLVLCIMNESIAHTHTHSI